jgi:fatty-acid desaturase
LLREDKSSSLELKSKYILSFIAALLACGGFRALVYISAKVLATRGSLALLVFILFASFNTRVAIVLGFRRLVATSSLSHKN